MTDLVAFLNARLDEDEAYLRELTEIGERKRDAMSEADIATNMPAFRELMTDPGVLRIMQRQAALGYAPPNDVSRLLREVEAKRAIVAIHALSESMGSYSCPVCITDREGYPEEWAGDDYPCPTLHHLAAVYSGHPDYQPEWAPAPRVTTPRPR